MSVIELVLDLLTDPNVVFILLALGTQAIIIELWTPGGWVAGFLGVVCLALALYGLGVIPVNWFGLLFIIVAFVLFIMELNTPTHGGLTAAGAASLVVGALVLFNSPGSLPFFRVNVPLVIGTAAALALASLAVLTYALRTIRRPALMGVETLVGQAGVMRTGDSAQVAGELWTVDAGGEALGVGDPVEVTEVKGLRLRVRKKK
jgi:membrane-bound serine protease (ClpP class)